MPSKKTIVYIGAVVYIAILLNYIRLQLTDAEIRIIRRFFIKRYYYIIRQFAMLTGLDLIGLMYLADNL